MSKKISPNILELEIIKRLPLILIATLSSYGSDENYTQEFIPSKMKSHWTDSIPTNDMREILRWKKQEIELSKNHKCVWRINLPKNRIEDVPVQKMKYVYRAVSHMESIREVGEMLKAQNKQFYIIFTKGGTKTKGAPPTASRLYYGNSNFYNLDPEVEATEPGTSIILDNIEIIEKGDINYREYVVYYSEKNQNFHLGAGYSLSIVEKKTFKPDIYAYPDIPKYTKKEVVGVGRLCEPWCGTAKGNRNFV